MNPNGKISIRYPDVTLYTTPSQGPSFITVTPMSFSDLPSRPEVYRDSSGNLLPQPNSNLRAFERTPAYVETTIQGEKVQAYVFQSGWNGHKCQIQIINGPDYLKNRVTEVYTAKKFGSAKRKCMMELNKVVQEHKNPHPILVQQNPALVNGDNVLSYDPLDTEEAREALAKEAGDNLTEAFAVEQPKDKPTQVLQTKKRAAQDPAPKEPPLKRQASNIIDNPYRILKNELKSVAKEVKSAGKEMMKRGDQKISEGKKIEQIAKKFNEQSNKLQKTLSNAKEGEKIGIDLNGKHYLVNKNQAEQFHTALNQSGQKSQILSQNANLDGKVTRVFGHGIKKGGKQLGKEIDGAGTAFGANALSNVTSELLNGNLITNGGLNLDTVTNIGTQSLKSTVVGGAQRVTYEVAKGAVKEVLPNVAKKIPGLNTIVGVVQVGGAIWNANSVEEAVENGVKTGYKIALNVGMQTMCNTLFPVAGVFIAAVATPLVEYMIEDMVTNC